MTRVPIALLVGPIAALALAGCGSSKAPGELPPAKTAAFVACLKTAGADPVALSPGDGTTRYFEPLNSLKPKAVYRLKNDLFVGIFDTEDHAHTYAAGTGEGLAEQFQERNVVTDVVKNVSQARSAAIQNEIIGCLPE